MVCQADQHDELTSANQLSEAGLPTNLLAKQPSEMGLLTNLLAEQPSEARLPSNLSTEQPNKTAVGVSTPGGSLDR
jgi:hypothetical protein